MLRRAAEALACDLAALVALRNAVAFGGAAAARILGAASRRHFDARAAACRIDRIERKDGRDDVVLKSSFSRS